MQVVQIKSNMDSSGISQIFRAAQVAVERRATDAAAVLTH